MNVRMPGLLITNKEIAGLAPFTSYAMVVRFYCTDDDGVGPPSQELDFRTNATREWYKYIHVCRSVGESEVCDQYHEYCSGNAKCYLPFSLQYEWYLSQISLPPLLPYSWKFFTQGKMFPSAAVKYCGKKIPDLFSHTPPTF